MRSASRMTSAHVVADEQHADALSTQAGDELPDLRRLMRSKRRRRLVHDASSLTSKWMARAIAIAWRCPPRHLPHRPLDIGEVGIEIDERLRRFAAHALLVEETKRAPRLLARERSWRGRQDYRRARSVW